MDELKNFNIDNLDVLERRMYDHAIGSGMTKEEALQVLINDVEGDTTQLSPELAKIAELQDTNEAKKNDEVIVRNVMSFEDFSKKIDTVQEPEHEIEEKITPDNLFTAGDINDLFMKFYDEVSEVSEQMSAEAIAHLKEAFKHLDAAWKAETEAHGIEWGGKYPVKL